MNIERRAVIIDCDPGIDDALAMMLAVTSPELDVKGFTICSGNVPAEQGAKNALKVLQLMNRLDIPVFIGEEIPSKRKLVTAQDTHGDDGLGETFYPDVTGVSYRYNGVDFILKSIKETPDLSIIALGPLTNLAKALEEDAETFNKVKEIVSMGGAFKSHGNCSPVAEFNYWVDPDAVKFVFLNSKVPFKMVGLDVTREIVLRPEEIIQLREINTDRSNFIAEITKFYVDFHWVQEGTVGCVINDPLAVAYFIDREMCSGFDSFIDVAVSDISLGQTVVDVANFYQKEANCHVLTEVDAMKFKEFFFGRVLPREKIVFYNEEKN